MLLKISKLLREYKQMFLIAYQSSPRYATSSIVLVLLQSVFPVASLYILKKIIDAAVNVQAVAFTVAAMWVVAFCLVLLLTAVCTHIYAHVQALFAQKISDYLTEKVLVQASQVAYNYYENPAYNDSLHLAQQQVSFKASQLLTGFTNLLLHITTVASVGGLLLVYNWQYALVFLLISFPLYLVKWFFVKQSFAAEKKLAPQEREAIYLQNVLTNITYAKEVRAYGFANSFINKFLTIRQYIFKEKKQIQNKQNVYSILIEVVEIVVVGYVFYLLAKNTWQRVITAGTFIIYLQGFQRLQMATKNFLQAFVTLYQQRLFVSHIFNFLSIKTKEDEACQAFPAPLNTIQFNQLNFAYPNTHKNVLHNISMQLKAGEVVAVVGENGCGKSTLIKLLARLYSTQSGDIMFNQTPIGHIDIKKYRSNTSFLFQDNQHYYLTVEENIAFSKSVDSSALQAAAKKAGAIDFIEKLPQQFKTLLGRMFISGKQLSGGQWQKLGIARMFYANTPLIVLDEPTSAIDPVAEFDFLKNLRSIASNKIIVFVTHRLYNLKIADNIIVMKEGQLVEQGRFDELLSQQGYFYNMYKKQIIE